MLKTQDLFDIEAVEPPLRDLLEVVFPWQILTKLDAFVNAVADERLGDVHPTAIVSGAVFLAEGAVIGPHACVEGPAWIGAGAEVGHAAFLRGGVILAPGAKVGHSSEVKRSLLLGQAKVPHFNYVGDSIVGRKVNLGAGVKLANFNTFGNSISVAGQSTGLRKFGAAVGDEVSIGCNAVLSPGTLVGARTVVYNGAMLRGLIPADIVVKLEQQQTQTPRH